jgi:hypothetical protein
VVRLLILVFIFIAVCLISDIRDEVRSIHALLGAQQTLELMK